MVEKFSETRKKIYRKKEQSVEKIRHVMRMPVEKGRMSRIRRDEETDKTAFCLDCERHRQFHHKREESYFKIPRAFGKRADLPKKVW